MNEKLEKFIIREAERKEYEALGKMTVEVYANLPDMPGAEEMPKYYELIIDVAARAQLPSVKIFVAVDPQDELLGSVTFVGDMKYYASGGKATSIKNSSGFRLLAVDPQARGLGVGRTLTEYCIERARALNSLQLVMHTTRTMRVAWTMYEKMGFKPLPSIDFQQASLSVCGFSLPLQSRSN